MKYFFLTSVFIHLAVSFSSATICCYTAAGTEQNKMNLPADATKTCSNQMSCTVSLLQLFWHK